eukprot:1222269-Alexandrium_andersonii.AAC.1
MALQPCRSRAYTSARSMHASSASVQTPMNPRMHFLVYISGCTWPQCARAVLPAHAAPLSSEQPPPRSRSQR